MKWMLTGLFVAALLIGAGFLMTDQQRTAQHLPKDWVKKHLPNLQELMDNGVSFPNAMTNSVACGPSRSTMLTSAYPMINGVEAEGETLNLKLHNKLALLKPALLNRKLTTLGLALIVWGWYTVYKGRKGLVVNGPYRFVRHPQYSGILLVAFGWIVHWPTILTMAMLPFLVWTYYRLAREEEEWLRQRFGGEFAIYRKKTPMFL